MTPDEREKQIERFRETARQLGADESDDALDRAMGKLNLRAKPKPATEPSPSDDR